MNPSWLQPGTYEIEAKLENPLRIGSYRLLVGAHESNARSSIFYIPDAIQFEVTSVSVDDQHVDYNNGLVNGKSFWKVSASALSRTETRLKPLLAFGDIPVDSRRFKLNLRKAFELCIQQPR